MEILFALLADGLFPCHYLGAQGIAYQSVEVDSLINPPLLKEGGEMFSFDSLRIHIGSIYDTDAPRTYTFPFRNVSGKNVRITKITLRVDVQQQRSVWEHLLREWKVWLHWCIILKIASEL